LAVKVDVHRTGALVDFLGIGEASEVVFLPLRGSPQADVFGFKAEQFVPGDGLTLSQVNQPYSNTCHARYYETQSHNGGPFASGVR